MLIMQLLRDNLTVGVFFFFLHLTFRSYNLLLIANMVRVSVLALIKKLEPWLSRRFQLASVFYLFSSNISFIIDIL